MADSLEPEFGAGYSRRQIELFRQFYRMFPIANALRSQLSWSPFRHCEELFSDEAISFGWTH
ncbi:DUF1016 N-terminal domain-containing protein [Pedobacter ginsengisoli]|uniref:DUF1016 N-terminal domain-containing protein n=1 Tax=Pedobacter ginsengisoli TaxID=363852 RepID=UPI00254B2D9B|nr:hypothetical protein [Pedobacter ginsengisoli]